MGYIGVAQLAAKQSRLFNQYAAEFTDTFGISLHEYWDKITGFDVVSFDENFIKPPEGTSTASAIRHKYGARAVALCKALIRGE
jgi:hypothetical protein